MSNEEKKQYDEKLVFRKYGNKLVEWKINMNRLQSDVQPKGVQVFYRKYYQKLCGRVNLINVRVVACVHDRSENTFYFQTCVYRRDNESGPFSKKAHRYTALERLMNKPMIMKIPIDLYEHPQNMAVFASTHGSFSWKKYTTMQDAKISVDWEKCQQIIIAQLEHPPQQYYTFTEDS